MGKTVSVAAPLLLQQPRAYDCLPACAAMLMAFHGRCAEIGSIASGMRTAKKSGTYTCDAGLYLLRQGFDVRIIEWDWEFPNRFLRLDRQEAGPEIRQWCRRRLRQRFCPRKKFYASLQAFVAAGGEYLPRPATLREMREELRANRPYILFIDPDMLWPVREKGEIHAVLTSAINSRNMTVQDPHRRHGGTKRYPLERIIFANHVIGGGALFARPKS